jgi:S1-C subfamily serine protease
MKYLLGCLCSALLGGLLAVYFSDSAATSRSLIAQDFAGDRGPASFGPRNAGALPAARPADPLPYLANGMTPDEQVNVSVYEAVNKSVVNITTKVRTDGLFLEITGEGSGSGSVLDKEGHILTNYHVIEGAQQVSVAIHTGKTYDATFVGADPVNDVAVVRIEAPADQLFPVTFGNSADLKVGMRVFAIGNPFGLERTLTTGIISSLNRSLQIHGNRTIKSIIQIDAAINPGNSGGPLLDTHGRLIGTNTAIASKTGQSAGVGFAIPINLIAHIVPQLISRGRVVRPEIGITKVYQTEEGLLIADLTKDGPAERAGLRGPQLTRKRRGPFTVERLDRNSADLIAEVDGTAVKTGDDFLGLIERKEPGQQVTLTIVREGRKMRVAVRLAGGEEPGPAPGPAPR